MTHTRSIGAGWIVPSLALLLTVAAGCGGSASETPWPAEPVNLEPGPAGEDLPDTNVIDTTKLPDNYNKTKKQAADGEPTDGGEVETDPAADPTDAPVDPNTPENEVPTTP